MKVGDEQKSVTHVSDVNCYPCPGLNKHRGGNNAAVE